MAGFDWALPYAIRLLRVLSAHEKILYLYRQATKVLCITYCESVFRKSSNENVEVFLIRRTARNNTHFRVGT